MAFISPSQLLWHASLYFLSTDLYITLLSWGHSSLSSWTFTKSSKEGFSILPIFPFGLTSSNGVGRLEMFGRVFVWMMVELPLKLWKRKSPYGIHTWSPSSLSPPSVTSTKRKETREGSQVIIVVAVIPTVRPFRKTLWSRARSIKLVSTSDMHGMARTREESL